MNITRLRNTLAALALAALAACGGGGAGTTGTAGGGTVGTASTGTAMVSLTDAPGDFLHYGVKVTSIQLTRADGTVVETLPATATQVDFAQLVDLSEVISAAQVQPGSYKSVQLTLDYSGASIVIDNGTATPITVAAGNIVDSANSPITAPVTLSLQLPAGQPLVITRGTVANLALDFNLALSNAITPSPITGTTSAATVKVQVNPTLSASIKPDATKSLRLRGPLVSVSTTDSTYTIHVRPFFKLNDSHGDLVVKTTSTTVFQINGASSTGSAGLTALNGVAAGTLTAATGSFDVASNTFTADTVLAGTSIPGAGLDSVGGTVIARTGNVLTVANGEVCDRMQDGESFSKSVAVTIGTATTVSKDGIAGSFTGNDISVGQHVIAFGKLGTDTAGNRTLDATAGATRLGVTSLWGLYTSNASGVVTLNLQSLDGKAPSAFNFAGTGTNTANDAVATSYTVGVPAALSLSGLTAGAPVRFFGFANAFGAAPPAFNAQSLANFAAATARLEVEFVRPGSTSPFVSPLSATNVVISEGTLQSTDEARVRIGPQSTDLKAATTGLTLVPNASATSTGYAIGHWKSRKVDTFATFADAIAALNTALNGTTAVLAIGSDGPFNATTGTLSVNHLFVVLGD
jgi:hypothetical protein